MTEHCYQIQRGIVAVVAPFGGLAVSLSAVREWMQIASLAVGIIGGIAAIAAVIHHWDRK
jgi:hypothetical protein